MRYSFSSRVQESETRQKSILRSTTWRGGRDARLSQDRSYPTYLPGYWSTTTLESSKGERGFRVRRKFLLRYEETERREKGVCWGGTHNLLSILSGTRNLFCPLGGEGHLNPFSPLERVGVKEVDVSTPLTTGPLRNPMIHCTRKVSTGKGRTRRRRSKVQFLRVLDWSQRKEEESQRSGGIVGLLLSQVLRSVWEKKPYKFLFYYSGFVYRFCLNPRRTLFRYGQSEY